MCTATSAIRTTGVSRSAVEYTATTSMPSSRQVRATRSAISPRLAMRILENIDPVPGCLTRLGRGESNERLVELDRLPVGHQNLDDPASRVRGDVIHQLHRLEHAERLAWLDHIADDNEGCCA